MNLINESGLVYDKHTLDSAWETINKDPSVKQFLNNFFNKQSVIDSLEHGDFDELFRLYSGGDILPRLTPGILTACLLKANIHFINKITTLYRYMFYTYPSFPIKSFIIPENIHTITSNVFSGCRSLKSLTFPHSIDAIDSCLENCSSIKEIVFDNTFEDTLKLFGLNKTISYDNDIYSILKRLGIDDNIIDSKDDEIKVIFLR